MVEARLQAKYALAAREDNRYQALDEREIAANLVDWLQDIGESWEMKRPER